MFKEGQQVEVTVPATDDAEESSFTGTVLRDAEETPVLVTGPNNNVRGYPIEWVADAPEAESDSEGGDK